MNAVIVTALAMYFAKEDAAKQDQLFRRRDGDQGTN